MEAGPYSCSPCIAHPLFGTLTHFAFSTDVIIVLKDGAVVEQGTHDELLGCNGLYAEMWRQQEGEEARQAQTSSA